MKILIVKLSSLGDVVHTFPAITDLAAARPDVEIDWVVEEAFVPIARLHPAVRRAYGVAFRRLRWPPKRWLTFVGTLFALRRVFRQQGYDTVVDVQGLMKSATVARLAGAPVTGYDAGSAREPPVALAYAHRYRVDRSLHAVERARRLLASAFDYDLPAGSARFGLARIRTPRIDGLPSRYYLAIHAASWPTKLWPETRWRRLLQALAEDGQAVVLPWGSVAERARAERLSRGVDHTFVLPHRLSVDELAGVIGDAEYAIGLDTGLMHIAVALGVPGIWLFGPTDSGLTGPYGKGQTVIQSDYAEAPCRRRLCRRQAGGVCCMSAIDVEQVLAAVKALNGGLERDQSRGCTA